MKFTTIQFLEAQKASANNPIGSHQARSRSLAIKLAKDETVAVQVAAEIESNLEMASEVSGMHPDSCARLAVWLKDWRTAL